MASLKELLMTLKVLFFEIGIKYQRLFSMTHNKNSKRNKKDRNTKIINRKNPQSNNKTQVRLS